MEPLDADALLSCRHITFIATGDTYPHREEFISWGWHWDARRGAWIEDNGSERDEPCIAAIRDLPGVVVREEPTDG